VLVELLVLEDAKKDSVDGLVVDAEHDVRNAVSEHNDDEDGEEIAFDFRDFSPGGKLGFV
jgi:hypothetical protein